MSKTKPKEKCTECKLIDANVTSHILGKYRLCYECYKRLLDEAIDHKYEDRD